MGFALHAIFASSAESLVIFTVPNWYPFRMQFHVFGDEVTTNVLSAVDVTDDVTAAGCDDDDVAGAGAAVHDPPPHFGTYV